MRPQPPRTPEGQGPRLGVRPHRGTQQPPSGPDSALWRVHPVTWDCTAQGCLAARSKQPEPAGWTAEGARHSPRALLPRALRALRPRAWACAGRRAVWGPSASAVPDTTETPKTPCWACPPSRARGSPVGRGASSSCLMLGVRRWALGVGGEPTSGTSVPRRGHVSLCHPPPAPSAGQRPQQGCAWSLGSVPSRLAQGHRSAGLPLLLW